MALFRRSSEIPVHFHGRVVMITGGTAGVGRATAIRFARRGARVGLIARDPAGLDETRQELEALGAEVATFAVDVSDADAVRAAADDCETRLGPIDVWVNNAMATVFSPVDAMDAAEIRRVTEVTYLGYVHGTLAALAHMRPRNRGVIVQVGSSLAFRGIPLQAAYCGAKHAIRGFTDSLRTELLHARSGVQLTAVHLPAINTPQFDWARSHDRGAPRPVAPVFSPDEAAKAILHAAAHPVREYWLGATTPATILANMVAPGRMDRYLASKAVEGQRRGEGKAARGGDNLFEPVAGRHRTYGAFGHEVKRAPVMMSAQTARSGAVIAACTLAAAAGLALGLRLAGRSGR
ncbi:SDR family oxidoreductase [Luteimonas sp. MHLX1A]|uniref:SDR family oxidoreductase n=1 Tax=Alterluteimonas muca TaxID=2878684 RepID=UPI001E5BE24F|nr:SDR family oxidoreductase [Luteimonas sp. MHLX1A]MCD9046656.1 SDR family oxidoreductase [Luteimonas sp. MHLX1A]